MSIRSRAAIAGALCASVVAALILVDPTSGGTVEGSRRCHITFIAASLGPGRPADERIAVQHCQPYWWSHGRAVDILTDGATYNQYWDWPEPLNAYSTVNKILASGRATVTYDRIGTGRSSRPHSSSAVTLDVDVWVLEQVLRWLKPHRYSRITSWLHSYGSAVGILHAATSGMTAVQQLVITGFLHTPRNPAVATRIYRANQDHRRWRNLDDGWVTTKPGTRVLSFYGPGVLPAVVRADEARKNVISATALGGFFAQHATPADANPARKIAAPVILVIGSYDAIFCASFNCFDAAAVTAVERPYYRTAASLDVIVAPAGHNLALEPSAADTFRKINDAIRRPPYDCPTAWPHRPPCHTTSRGEQ